MTLFIKTQVCSKSIKTWTGKLHNFFRKMITSAIGERRVCDSGKGIKRASVISKLQLLFFFFFFLKKRAEAKC